MEIQTISKVYIINGSKRVTLKATPAYIQLMLETVEKEPQELGYEFGRWTGERLATYLAQQTGIELSGSQVRRMALAKKV